MSQRLTEAVAQTLKRGDILYHNLITFPDGEGGLTPATAKVTGKCRHHSIERFVLPIKLQYGTGCSTIATGFAEDYWRTVPEKEVVRRIVRTHVPVAVAAEESPVVRVRRARPTVQEELPLDIPTPHVRRTRRK